MSENKLNKIVSLCKRRGFIFQSSEIYGGLKSAYDFGPLGVELKRNISNHWWSEMVTKRNDIVGLDASIFMHPNVWKASGHLDGFSDPLVDCKICKERFRTDKAEKVSPGSEITITYKKKEFKNHVSELGVICPVCGGADLSDERQFNLMFRTSLGPVDFIDRLSNILSEKSLSKKEIKEIIQEAVSENAVYLRPETAQAMFVQFQNIQQSQSMKVPFGIAQIGKSFRNEIKSEKFIFRTAEFEQMEMEFFVEPGTELEWIETWSQERLNWWKSLSNTPDNFILREHEKDELAHYANKCYDIEYKYPWGYDELEGVASRTDYDLKKHAEHSGTKLSYFDQQKQDPETGKNGWRYTPYVIEPAAGLTRGVLAFLCDAYTEETVEDKTRCFLKLDPKLAPFKCAILPLVKKDGLAEIATELSDKLLSNGIANKNDAQQSIGKRYAKHDEIGTPFCITVDHQTKEDKTVTLRDRDTTEQKRISIKEVIKKINELNL